MKDIEEEALFELLVANNTCSIKLACSIITITDFETKLKFLQKLQKFSEEILNSSGLPLYQDAVRILGAWNISRYSMIRQEVSGSLWVTINNSKTEDPFTVPNNEGIGLIVCTRIRFRSDVTFILPYDSYDTQSIGCQVYDSNASLYHYYNGEEVIERWADFILNV